MDKNSNHRYLKGFPALIYFNANVNIVHAIVEIDNRLEELQNELLHLANSKADYTNLAEEIYRL